MVERVQMGSRIQLHFSISLLDGVLIDSSRHRNPAPVLVVGSGDLPTGFEQVLLGLKSGDQRSCVVTAAEAFGQRLDAHVQSFNRTEFGHMDLAVGMVISFGDRAKSELPGVVRALDAQRVQVDFNHPLAGRDLCFEVEIMQILAQNEQPVQLIEGAYAHQAG